jgi:hypothetical protein
LSINFLAYTAQAGAWLVVKQTSRSSHALLDDQKAKRLK